MCGGRGLLCIAFGRALGGSERGERCGSRHPSRGFYSVRIDSVSIVLGGDATSLMRSWMAPRGVGLQSLITRDFGYWTTLTCAVLLVLH